MADKFGEVILLVKADDTQLKATLLNDESVVIASQAKMQASLDKTKVSMGALSFAGGETSASLGVVGASISLIGGQAAAAIVPVVGLATAINSLSASFAVAVIAVGAIGVVIAEAFNIGGLRDWLQGLGEAKERLKEQQTKLKDQEQSIRKLVVAQEQRLKILKGEAIASDFISNTQLQIATKAAEAAESAKISKVAREAEAATTVARIIALDRQLLILTGERKEHEFIKNAMEREAFLALKKATAMKAAADAAKAEAKAKRDTRAAEGPGSLAAADVELTSTLALIKRERLILGRRRSVLALEARRLGLSKRQIQAVSDKLGLGLGTGTFETVGTSGASGGRSARGFTDIASISGAGGGPDSKRERQLEQLIDVGEKTLLATRENKPAGVAA